MGLDREPQKLNSLMDSIQNQFNLTEKRIVVDLRNNVESIISESFSKSVIIYDLKDGKLILKVSNPIWKTEIQLRKVQIVEKFNSYLGANIIKNIVLH